MLLASCFESERGATLTSVPADDRAVTSAGPLQIALSNLRAPTELPEGMGFGPNAGGSYAALDVEILNTSASTVRFTALDVAVSAVSGRSLSWQALDVDLVKATEIEGLANLAARLYIQIPEGEALAALVFDPRGIAATIPIAPDLAT